MRRYMRKPAKMSTREFVARLQELNAYLKEFPPFGGDEQMLADNDLAEILKFGIPNSWQRAMVLQGFNAIERSVTDTVEFCERLEFTEQLSNDLNGKNSQTDSSSGKKNRKSGGKTSKEASNKGKHGRDRYCPLHDTNGHDIWECKVLLNQAKKMRESWTTQSSSERAAKKKKDKEVNAVMKEFADALRDGRITKKRKKRLDGSAYDVFNIEEGVGKLTVDSDNESAASNPSIWQAGESLFAFSDELELGSNLDSNLTKTLYRLGQHLDRRNAKKTQTPLKRAIAFGLLNTSLGKPKMKTIRILCDTGATATIVKHNLVKKLRQKREKPTSWNTPAGMFKTHKKMKLNFMLPEFHKNKAIEWEAHVTKQPMSYDVIMGEDLLRELGLILDYKQETITWEDATVGMRALDSTPPPYSELFRSDNLQSQAEKMHDILAAKYKPADLQEVVSNCTHLTEEERQKLFPLLKKYEDLLMDLLATGQTTSVR